MNRVIRTAILAVIATGLLAAAQTAPPAPQPPPAATAPAATPAPAQTPSTPKPPRPPRAPKAPRARAYSSTATHGGSYLGVDIRDLTPEQASALKLKDTHGVEITMVDQDAPAGKAGLKEHDVIVSVNGASLNDVEQLRKIIRDTLPGRNITLGLSRNGQPVTVNVKLGERGHMAFDERHIVIPKMDIRIPEIDIPSFTMLQYSRRNGLVVENLTPQLGEFFGVKNGEGVLVRSVEKGSVGESAGFHAGDVIVKVGKEGVCDSGEWNRLMRKQSGGTVPVTVMRDKREQSLSLPVPERHPDQSEVHFDFPDVSGQIAQLGPELQRAQERMQRELRQHQKEWQANADKAQRQARKEMERARRELERALREMQQEMEKP
jgi:membrane-associated protease RseP (regulator of RpoE activity)